jgi:PPK2 family polyphosphate:nucleotide phosphotransferase
MQQLELPVKPVASLVAGHLELYDSGTEVDVGVPLATSTREAAPSEGDRRVGGAQRGHDDVPVPGAPMTDNLPDLLRVVPGAAPVTLVDVDPRSTPCAPGGKSDTKDAIAELRSELSDLQGRLHAEGRAGGSRRVLVVLQGMDTSGKGGAVKHLARQVNPAGLRITAFGPPTDEERAHSFLWRVEKRLPEPGFVGVFDRSHYEDVLIARVHDLVPPEQWERRYDEINDWEAGLVASGVTLLKVMLHISPDEQRERLLARLDDPTKHWNAYQTAYEAVLERCSTPAAPWYVVPADRKWYRNFALSSLLLDSLRGLDLQWPQPELDLEALRTALHAT